MSGSAGDAPVLEGEHRLGEGMRRGVFCLGLVPVATGLTLREAMWMQCCLTAGVEPGPMPAHAFRRADRHAVEDAMGVAPGLMRAMAADAHRHPAPEGLVYILPRQGSMHKTDLQGRFLQQPDAFSVFLLPVLASDSTHPVSSAHSLDVF